MQLIKNYFSFFLFTYSMLVSFLSVKADKMKQDVNNENKAFPNDYQAATMKENLENAKFTAPPLSRALYEADPTRKMKLTEFLGEVRFTMYNMTKGETTQMFYFIDKNKDELVDQKEFDDFALLYIYPFEACDENKNYLLEDKEFTKCFEKDPNSEFIKFPKEKQKEAPKLIMDSVTTRGKEIINFNDYLVYRRGTFGWRQCQTTSTYISREAFACALRTALPVKYHLNADVNRFYTSGLKECNDPNLIDLDYICYLRTYYYSYVFITFSFPNSQPVLAKTDFLKSIRDDRLPQNFSEEEVKFLYELMDNGPTKNRVEMNVESWFFWFHVHRLFNKYSSERPAQLTEKEMLSLLQDKFFEGGKIVASIDNSVGNCTESQYLEASLILNRERTNEKSFFYKFKEASSSNLKSNQFVSGLTQGFWKEGEQTEPQRNETTRQIFFHIPLGNNKEGLNRKNYFRAMQVANFFTYFIKDSTNTVAVTDLQENIFAAYDKVSPPFSMKQRSNFPYYRALPHDTRIDIYTFMTLELWKSKTEEIKLYSNKYIEETDLKSILRDYGLDHLPDSVIDLSQKGFDSMRRRIYDPKEVISHIVNVEAVAGELERTRNRMTKYHVKEQKESSRKFFNWPRRAQASPRA